MAEPCSQQGVIGGLEATQEAIQNTLTRLEKGQERFITILETMSSQGTKIEKIENDQEQLFSRVRKVELGAVEHSTKVGLASGFISIVVAAVVAFIVKHLGK